jgi:putative flavoprotein involved in K+ transport
MFHLPVGGQMETYDVLVIGGGQSGLAAGYHLQRAGLRFLILEASEEATGSWKRYYDSLKLFSPARYSSLPGMRFPGKPERYPSRDEVIDYLRTYAEQFHLPIRTHAFVERIEQQGSNFIVDVKGQGILTARSIIAATGAFSRPHLPQFDRQDHYQGKILHSSSYQNPMAFKDQRVLVVGAGNSAVQIAVDLTKTAQVTLTSRDPVKFRRQRIWGRDVHFWVRVTGLDTWKRAFPSWDPSEIKKAEVLDTGVYQAALASGKPAYHVLFTRFTENGVQWDDGQEEDFDSVIFATGFRPNFPYLAAIGALDDHGNALHIGGVSTTVPGLYYVGISGQRAHASATLRGSGDDAAYIIRNLRRYFKRPVTNEAKRCCGGLQPA